MNKQNELEVTVNQVKTILMDGFKAEARTILSGKLGKDDAEEMLATKYDVETALVMENSITDCVMQVAEFETDLVSFAPFKNFCHQILTSLFINFLVVL